MARRDTHTLDLFKDVKPAPAVARFNEEQVRSATLEGRVARSVAAALKDSGQPRASIAARMSEFVGEDVSVAMLDAWASQAKEGHRIPATRLLALCVVLSDERPLNALLGHGGIIAVPARFEALIRREMAKEAIQLLQREAETMDAEWRARR